MPYRKLDPTFVGVSTAKPVDTTRSGGGSRTRQCDLRFGLTDDHKTSPFRTPLLARPGASVHGIRTGSSARPTPTDEMSRYLSVPSAGSTFRTFTAAISSSRPSLWVPSASVSPSTLANEAPPRTVEFGG